MERAGALELAAVIQRLCPEIAVRIEGEDDDHWLLCARLYRTPGGLNSFELFEVRSAQGWYKWLARIEASQSDDEAESQVARKLIRLLESEHEISLYTEGANAGTGR